ncbi:kinase-like domain-containing protein [Tricladium varicosporioides]|nr:kinase-like domain-containing protein [Hymenoscyphus varicosporioides]
MAIDTPEEIHQQVQESLKDGPYACSSLAKLSGGTANFVYRGTLTTPLPDGSETVVIKHTKSYVALSVTFKLTSTRCDYEQAILTSLEGLPPVTNSLVTVTTPKIYSFIHENDTGTQVYSDLPSSSDLKTYALTHALSQEQCSRVGFALGAWAKAFHTWAAAPEQESLREKMKGNTAMKELKYRLNYTNLVTTIDNFPELLGESRGVFEEVAKNTREELNAGEGLLIHGDFWSGNVLLPDGPLPDSSHALKLFVIDWELSHLSHPAFDLGQMFAEMFELKHFKNIDAGVWLIEGFMAGYGNLELEMACKTAIHVGAHLICWGTRVQGWGTKEQIEELVKVGRDFVRKGWEEDVGFFLTEGGPLRSLFLGLEKEVE